MKDYLPILAVLLALFAVGSVVFFAKEVLREVTRKSDDELSD